MIIIDENAETKLAEQFRKLEEESQTMRCIYLNLMDKPEIADMQEKIIELSVMYFSLLNTQLYVCEDGDIFILAPHIPSKSGRDFIVDVATHAKIPASESWIGFYEVSVQINKLLLTVETKLEKRRNSMITKQKILEQQQHERKRQAILNSGSKNQYEDIRQRRVNHSAPELMMIEDDVFSRRLVENVLQKKYAITGLGEATIALDTYARIAPDMLFLDIDLPDVTGHELLERILLMDPDAYVVMLSGKSDQSNIVHAMNKGAKGFIAKPFTREKIFQYIDRCPAIAHYNQKNVV